MRHVIPAGILALLLSLAAGWAPASAADTEEPPSSVSQELHDLGREIKRAMKEKGEYVGDKLGELGREGRSWLSDRGLQARVKTTLTGVVGVGSLGRINVDVSQGVVTLTGELSSWEEVARVVQATNQVEGVRRVVSRLRAPGST
ncbi:MAG TPA: BON domain-containing protein [Gammaproteobacteria bacterium]|nr:BON domain-containing protein [Gammaproteobacteria bacterium]